MVGTYTSVWDGGDEVTVDTLICMANGQVFIQEIIDPDEIPLDCDILEGEYVTVNNKDYECHNIDEYESPAENKWSPDYGFWYEW